MTHMILLNAWNETLWSYTFYFSYGIVVLLSIPTAIVRPIQVLYKGRLQGLLVPTELFVEFLRLFQYCVILTCGMKVPLRSIFSSVFWRHVLLHLRQLHFSMVAYQLIGFVIVFGVINIILFMIILRKSTVAIVMEKLRDKTRHVNHLDVSTVRTASMLVVKNMLVIPVSMIYMFYILNLI